MAKLKNLEKYIVAANTIEQGPINEAFDLVFNMIDDYNGPEKGHRAKVMSYKTSLKQGLSTEKTIRRKLFLLIGGVGQVQKVI